MFRCSVYDFLQKAIISAIVFAFVVGFGQINADNNKGLKTYKGSMQWLTI